MDDTRLYDDDARIAALHRLNVLDTAAEKPFEKIVTLVRTVLAVPIATVTLVDRDRQWFKAQRGLDQQETPRAISFCTHTIQQREPLIVEDAHLDPRFAASPMVVGPPHIRSYAGIPLRTPEGYNVGSLCAMDTRARRFSPADIAILSNFANIVCDELELRLIAQVDHLTGALTRRGFVEQAEREMARSRRYERPSTLVMLDVDHFKMVNDTYPYDRRSGAAPARQAGRGHATADRRVRPIGRRGIRYPAAGDGRGRGTDRCRAPARIDRRIRDAVVERCDAHCNGELWCRRAGAQDDLRSNLDRAGRCGALCRQGWRPELHAVGTRRINADVADRKIPATSIVPAP